MVSGLGCGMAAMEMYLVWGFYYSVPLVVGQLFLFCSIPERMLQGWNVHGSLCRFAPLCENKKNPLCDVVWVRFISI